MGGLQPFHYSGGPEARAQWITKRISQKLSDAVSETAGLFLMSSG